MLCWLLFSARWLDASSSTLYFMANGSAPAATGWVGSHLETVLHVAGPQDKPVVVSRTLLLLALGLVLGLLTAAAIVVGRATS